MDEKDDIEPPPLFSSWRGLYLAVLLNLALLIGAFWLFTKHFS